MLDYKRAGQSDQSVRSNSVSLVLRQVVCLKIAAVKIQRIEINAYKTVVSRITNSRVKGITYKCGLHGGCEQIRIKNGQLML